MIPTIRPLTWSDLDTAEAILKASFSRAANRRAVLEMVLTITPDGWFLALMEGVPIGMVGAVCFPPMAWIGLMAVIPQWQSRGVGRILMNHVLGYLDQRDITTILLDASPAGRPLYQSLGFVDGDESQMFERKPEPGTATPVGASGSQPGAEDPARAVCSQLGADGMSLRPIRADDLSKLSAFDALAYGANRQELLEKLFGLSPHRCFLAEDAGGAILGYVCNQENRIGPWISLNAGVAEILLRHSLRLPFSQAVGVIAPGKNPAVRDILLRHGFTCAYANRHMWRGEAAPEERRELLYGQSNFAYG